MYNIYAVRHESDVVYLIARYIRSLEQVAEAVEMFDLQGNWPEGYDAVAVDDAKQSYEDVNGTGKFVHVGDCIFNPETTFPYYKTRMRNMVINQQTIDEIRAGVARAKRFPQAFKMETWGMSWDAYLHAQFVFDLTKPGWEPPEGPPCGSVGCLAFEIGAAIMESQGDEIDLRSVLDFIHKDSTATQHFSHRWGIDIDIVSRLFVLEYWPFPFQDGYRDSPEGSLERAEWLEKYAEFWISQVNPGGELVTGAVR